VKLNPALFSYSQYSSILFHKYLLKVLKQGSQNDTISPVFGMLWFSESKIVFMCVSFLLVVRSVPIIYKDLGCQN
jgi:hypothetical protein